MRPALTLPLVWLAALTLISAPAVTGLDIEPDAPAAVAADAPLTAPVAGAHPTADPDTGTRRPPAVVTHIPAPAGRAGAPRAAVPPAAAAPLSVVALGDSVPSGYLNDGPSYVTRVGALLGEHRHRAVTVHNLAFAGAESADALDQVRHDEETRAALRGATVVMVQVGANDMDEDRADDARCEDPWACWSGELNGMRTNLQDTLAEIRVLAPGATLVVADYWNVWLDGSVAQEEGDTYVTVSRALTASVNALVKQVTVEYHGVFVPTAAAMDSTGDRDDLLLPDGNHPDAEGHAALAAAIVAGIEASTRP